MDVVVGQWGEGHKEARGVHSIEQEHAAGKSGLEDSLWSILMES